MKDSIKTSSVGQQIKRLFLSCGLKFDYGHKDILKENKETARIYTDSLESFNVEIVEQAIKISVKKCDHLSNPLPKLPMLVAQCARLIKYNQNPEPEPEGDVTPFRVKFNPDTREFYEPLSEN